MLTKLRYNFPPICCLTPGETVVEHGEEEEEVVQAGQDYQQVVEGVPGTQVQ